MESGTCNACFAPCASWMHPVAATIELDDGFGSSYDTSERKEVKGCSFVGFKSRSLHDLQTATCGSSSNDSYSENVESKATLRKSIAYDTCEDINMPIKVSSVEAVKEDKVLQRGTATSHGMSCSYCTDNLHHGALDGEWHVSGCHGNSDSCTTEASDVNMLVLDCSLELDKRDAPCSSISTCKLGTKETKMLIQVETTHESEGSFKEVSQVNSGKLSTFPGESFCKKSPSLDLPSKSDITEPSPKDISPKVNLSSHSQSERIFNHNADCNHMEANKPSKVLSSMFNNESSYQGLLSVGGDHGQKSIMFPNSDASRATQIRSDTSSREFKNEDRCFESVSGFRTSESNVTETQQQSLFHGQVSESEDMLYDVKVCDICGDAGRENLLATCSRCIDGAEHTYCMRIMLNKVPEGDWLCEECQLKEEIEIKKMDKSEPTAGTSEIQYLSKKIKNLGNSVNPENLLKLNTKSADPEACGVIKEMQNPASTVKRHMNKLDAVPATNKKVSETSDEASRTASPRISTVLSCENSFKNLHTAEVKRTDIASLPGCQSENSSWTFSHSSTLCCKPSNVQRELYTPRGSLSKQVSFKKKSAEPKVKQLAEGVPQKLAKACTSRNTKKESLVKTIKKSSSFKIVSSSIYDIRSSNKAQSLKSPRDEDPKGFKQLKERNVLERKSSFVLGRPLVSPPIRSKSLSNMNMKIAPLNRNSSKNFEASILGTSKGCDREKDLGYKEVKQQSSFKCESHGICDSENQKMGKLVIKEPVHANSIATNRSYHDAGGVTRSSVSRADNSHQAHLDNKTKSISSTSRLAILGGECCGKLKEVSHATQSCQSDKLSLSSAKPSADVSSIDGTGKRNRWKDAAKAAMSRNKKSRMVDQSEECRLLSSNVISEGSSRSSLTSSICQHSPLEGTPDKKVTLRSSDTDYSKMDSANNIEQMKHSTVSSYIPGVGDLNVNPRNLDELNKKPLTQFMLDHTSLTISRSLVGPEHEFIWQGAFEILRIGRLPEMVDGIQAHLSNFASLKVHEVACQFPCKIQLEEVPRINLWPLQFRETSPKENNIALYFFAKNVESYERSYQKLLEAALKNDLALKGNINEVELLIFPSSMLPESSQRWNMLFFLWGIFRDRKSDSLKPHTNLEECCGSKITTDTLVQESSSSHTHELSTIQKLDFHQYPPKEFSGINESPEPKTVKFNASVDLYSVSSAGPTVEFPSTKIFLYKAASEKESSKLSDHTSHLEHRNCSFDLNEICAPVKSNGTTLGNMDNDANGGKIPHIHANSAQQNLSGSVLGYSAASCFRQDSDGKEIKEKQWPVKVEVRPEENITEVDCLSWDSKHNMKRTSSCSATSCGETSQDTIGGDMCQVKASFVSLEDDRDHKRMKCYSEGHGMTNFRNQNVECKLPSKVQPFLTSYLHEQQQRDGGNYGNMIPQSLKCAERNFFPLDLCPVKKNVVENFRYFLSSDNEHSPESAYPDLELALGGKKKPSKKEIVPLFFPSVDKGRLDKLSGSTVDEDDLSASLSLSLASPGMEKKRAENPVLKGDQCHGNTSLILFGGFTDT